MKHNRVKYVRFPQTDDKTFAEYNIFYAHIPANVYAGKYYDYRATLVPVVAKCKEDVPAIINNSKLAVIHYLASRKDIYGKYQIPFKNPEKNVFFKDDYTVTPVKYINARALHPDGQFRIFVKGFSFL